SFTYTVSDGVASSTGTVSLSVTNSSPGATNDSYSVTHDHTLSVSAPGVLANDWDMDGDTLSVTSNSSAGHGSVTVNSNGSFTYTPNAGYVGSYSFTYTVSDGAGTDTATVSLTVTNQNPVANDDSYSGLHDQDLTDGSVLDNDTDAD